MKKTYVMSAGATALTAATTMTKEIFAVIKLGVDVHAACCVVVA